MNWLSLLFFFPVIVSGILSVEKVQDKTIPQIETYKNIQVDSDRNTCACWSQCKVDSECTAVSIVPSSLGSTEASCLFTKLTSAAVKTQLQTESGAVTFLKDSITSVTNVVQAVGTITTEAITTTEATTTTTEATTTTTEATTTAPQEDPLDDCPYDEINSDQVTSKFLLFRCKKKFSESKDICTKVNGVLASLSDSDTFDKITSILQASYWRLSRIWVDVTRVGDNAYVWGDGNSLPSTGTGPWHRGQPDGNDECANLLSFFKYALDDKNCDGSNYFLCDV